MTFTFTKVHAKSNYAGGSSKDEPTNKRVAAAKAVEAMALDRGGVGHDASSH